MRLLITDYTLTPGPGLEKEGEFSGEDYRKRFVEPAFNTIIELVARYPETTDNLTIDLDGAYGYSYEWLEEVFGGMVICATLEDGKLFGRKCCIRATIEPELIVTIQSIVGGMLKLVDELDKKKKKTIKIPTQETKVPKIGIIRRMAAFLSTCYV